MAWVNFGFGVSHVARDDPDAVVSIVDSTGAASVLGTNGVLAGALVNVYDDRASSMLEWDDGERVRLDRGTSPDTISRLYIPPGHNLTALEVFSRQTPTGSTTSEGTWSGTAGDPILVALTGLVSADRYLDLDVTTSGGANARIGELFYTWRREPSIGPDREWPDRLEPVAQRSTLQSGGSAIVFSGTSQRLLTLAYPHVTNATDKAILAAVEASGGRPLLLTYGYDDEDPRWVYLDGASDRVENSRLPTSFASLVPRYRFPLRDHTL